MLTQTIPSYLFTEYADDDNLQGFVAAYNALAQEYVTFFATVDLPIYTGLSGSLLDWVAEGLYGITRPIVPTVAARAVGPINTWAYNTIPLNTRINIVPAEYSLATDDIFKRVITWHFLKGDGKAFTIEWLKRRVTRFLNGTNGVNYNVDQTYQVSVEFGGGNEVQIGVLGAFPNVTATIFAYCVRTGILELPFQYVFNVTI